MGWIKSLKRGVVYIFVFGIVFFITGEIVTRIAEKAVYKIYSYKAKENPHGPVQWELYKKYYKSVPEKPYRYEHRANVNLIFEKGYYTMHVKTNSEGLREERDYNYLEKSVIFLGDSIVEGASVDNNQTFESIFEKLTGITALNFGIGSSNTRLEYYFLKEKYKPSYNTCHIILGFCLNDWCQEDLCFSDSYGNWIPCEQLGISKETSLWQKIKSNLKKSHFIRFIYTVYKKTFFKPFSAKQLSRDQIIETEKWILKIKKFADEIGACFTVVIFPMVEQFTVNYAPGERQQDVLIEILKKHNINYIDLYDFLKKEYLKDKSIYWDGVHPYIKGHRLIGEYLVKHLKVCKCGKK
jgi:hypothetical protein